MKCRATVAGTALVLVFLSGCRGKTEQQRLKETIQEIGRKTEKRDLPGLLAHLSEDYLDFEGRDKTATREMVGDYFGQYRGIVIHLLATRVGAIAGNSADIQTETAISSGGALLLRQLFSQWGECYRFSFRMKKEKGRWLISRAEWVNVSREGLFPESLEILRTLLSN